MTDYEKQINTAAFRVVHEQYHAAAQISTETGTDFFDVLHDIKNRIRYLWIERQGLDPRVFDVTKDVVVNHLPADITGYRKI
jgi:hypothetical protein